MTTQPIHRPGRPRPARQEVQAGADARQRASPRRLLHSARHPVRHRHPGRGHHHDRPADVRGQSRQDHVEQTGPHVQIRLRRAPEALARPPCQDQRVDSAHALTPTARK